VFLRILEQVRRKYKFEVVGYVVMPEHFHMLIGEPQIKDPSVVLQVLKQRVPNNRRCCDCWGGSAVKGGLVRSPELWVWSSFRAYMFGEQSVVKIDRLDPNPTIRRTRPGKDSTAPRPTPPLRKARKGGAPTL
jgi:putative transposase